MDLLTSLTIFAPTLAAVFLANARLKTAHRKSQLKIGGFFLGLASLPLIGLYRLVPGGSLSDLPPELAPKIDYILTLAISPVIGTLVLSVMLVGRGCWGRGLRSRQSGS